MTRDNATMCAMAVMAKAPRPGHVKTRLQGVLLPEEATALGIAFLRDAVGNVHAAAAMAPIAPFVGYAPEGQESRFDELLLEGTSLLLADGSDGDAAGVEGLGRVLLGAMRGLLGQGFGAACVLGADSPTLPTAELARAARALLAGDCDAVLGAVDDGGYYLLGLRAPHPAPFARIRWSTEWTCADTRAGLAESGLRTVELLPWFDVDDAPSLRRLLEAEAGYAAPHTTEALDRLQLRARLQIPA